MQSIQSQTFKDFELVAIDDHSNDQSRKVIANMGDSRFRVHQNPGEGLVDALNFGIQQCRCEWIVRMDADDIMHTERLNRLWQETREHPDFDLIASRVKMFPENEIQSGYREYIRWQNNVLSQSQIANQIFVESPFAHPSVMLKKSTILDSGYYQR